MKISDLKIGQSKVDVEAEVKSIEEPRSFSKFGKEVRVANAIIDDGSGSMKLTLWNDDIDKVKEGSKVKITNGYVNEFNGEKQLTAGKFGKMEIGGKGKAKKETEDETEDETEEEPEDETEEESEDETEEESEDETEEESEE